MSKLMQVFIIPMIVLAFSTVGLCLENQADNGASKGNVVYIEVPKEISREQVLSPTRSTKDILDSLVSQEVSKISQELESQVSGQQTLVDKKLDLIIALTKDGKPILQDRGVLSGTKVNDLSFTFNSPAPYQWSPTELAAIQDTLYTYGGIGSYQAIKNIFGPPAFSNTVNIRKDAENGSFSGFYNLSLNEISICGDWEGTDYITLTHELVHVFDDDYLIGLKPNYSEGIAEAVTILTELFPGWEAADFDDRYQVKYDNFNQPFISPKDGIIIQGYYFNQLRYYVSSYAFGKLFIEDPNFFKTFNQLLFSYDPQTMTYEQLKQITQDAKQTFDGTVEGLSFPDWHKKQFIFDIQPELGPYFIIYDFHGNRIWPTFFSKEADNREYGVESSSFDLDLKIFDDGNNLLYESSQDDNTNWAGGKLFDIPSLAYNGRIEAEVTSTPESFGGSQIVRSFFYYFSAANLGIYGVVVPETDGTVSITDRQTAQTNTYAVSHGAFGAPEYENSAGSFLVEFDGQGKHYGKVVTKGKSNYFVLLSDLPQIRLIRKVPMAFQNQPVVICAKISDNVIIQTAKLFYRHQGEATFQELALAYDAVEDIYSVSLPLEAMTLGKMEYYLEAQDDSGNVETSPVDAPDYLYNFDINDFNIYVDIANAGGTEDGSTGSPFNTISEAITSAKDFLNYTPGPINIYVAAGNYVEAIKLDNKAINLIGAGASVTTIDGGGTASYVIDRLNGILEDFTIKGSGTGFYDSGVFLYGGASPVIKNNIFYNNNNGIRASQTGTATIINNTMVNNRWSGIMASYTSSISGIKDNIIAFNKFGVYCFSSPQVLISYNDVYGNTSGNYSGCSAGANDISADPLFVDAANANYHLKRGSPCIDAGDPASDYSLEPEPNGNRVDMGSFGNTPEATAYICGDANADNKLNALDVTYIISYLYRGGPVPKPLLSADVDGNGSVNALDVTYLINYLYRGGAAPVCR